MHPVGADAHIGPHTAPSYIAHRGVRLLVRIRPNALVNAIRYRRDDVGIVPYERDGLPCVVCWAGTSSDTVRHKAAARHPLTGWGRRPCGIRRGDCAICGWRYG